MNIVMQALNFSEEITSKYEIIHEMGRGAFSTVYKIKSKEDNNIYCLKKINIKKTADKKNEVNILSKLNHPNLVQYISSCTDEEAIYIIMEYCVFGDLYTLLHMVKKKRVYVNEDIIWDIAYQGLLGLEYLHSQHIIHRDIKLLNIFMSKNKAVKIGDMGMSKLLTSKEMKLSRVGTPLYLAPELVRKEKYDFKADIWSFGCSLYHLARTVPPFNDENLIRLGQAIVNESPPPLPSCYSDKLNSFINKLMTKDKKHRPSATEAIQLIPQKTKDKFDISNYPNTKIADSKLKNNKDDKSVDQIKTNNKINNSSKDRISISSSVNINSSNIQNSILNLKWSNNNKTNNELISGQTFYKFFKKNTDRTERKSIQYCFVGSKNSNISSSQNLLFDSKNMNSYLIMSKTMGGTKEGFFKQKNNIYNIEQNQKQKDINAKNNDVDTYNRKEEQKNIDNNNYNKNNNNNIIKEEINNLVKEETKDNYKPLIIKEEKKNNNNLNNNNDVNNGNKNIDDSKTSKNNNIRNVKDNLINNNIIFRNKIPSTNNSKDKFFSYNFYFKKNKDEKNKTGINFFNANNNALLKQYQKEINKIKQVENNDLKKKDNISFPIIKTNRVDRGNTKGFNNLLNNKINIFGKTSNGFPFHSKLTIHDL